MRQRAILLIKHSKSRCYFQEEDNEFTIRMVRALRFPEAFPTFDAAEAHGRRRRAGQATVSVTAGNGRRSSGTVRVEGVAPGLFTQNNDGKGVPSATALRIKADGSQVNESISRFDATTNRFVPADGPPMLTAARYRTRRLSLAARSPPVATPPEPVLRCSLRLPPAPRSTTSRTISERVPISSVAGTTPVRQERSTREPRRARAAASCSRGHRAS